MKIIEKKIEPKNFIDTLKENKFFKEIDLFSLDIDSYDYWVLKELPKNFCKIIVAEFNPYFEINLRYQFHSIKILIELIIIFLICALVLP